jgi:DNA-binding Lrp family transcriptional regulator
MPESETDRDFQIITYVLRHPNATRAEIAAGTNIPDSTVQRRMAALQENGDLISQFVVGPENRVYRTRALIGVKLQTAGIKCDKYNFHNQKEMVCFIKWGLNEFPEFSELADGVILERVEQSFGGPYELIIVVAAVTSNELAAFVTGVIQKLPGVIETTTTLIVSYSKSVWKPKQIATTKKAQTN